MQERFLRLLLPGPSGRLLLQPLLQRRLLQQLRHDLQLLVPSGLPGVAVRVQRQRLRHQPLQERRNLQRPGKEVLSFPLCYLLQMYFLDFLDLTFFQLNKIAIFKKITKMI